MIRIAIVDDDAESAEELKKMILRFAGDRGQECVIRRFSNAMDFVSDYKPLYDLVFSETELPYLDGISAARRLRKIDGEVTLIFVTKHAKHAIEGYDVGALDYLLKPVSYKRLSLRLEKVFKNIEITTVKKIAVTVDGVLRLISSRDIYYIEVSGHMLIINTRSEQIVTRGKLDEMEETLKNYGFFRIYKCYLINLNYVQEVRQSAAVVNGRELTLSRHKRKLFLEELEFYK